MKTGEIKLFGSILWRFEITTTSLSLDNLTANEVEIQRRLLGNRLVK